jgi:hypothetical protein
MGDIADALIEEGMDLFLRHQAGLCGDGWCPYCDDPEENPNDAG